MKTSRKSSPQKIHERGRELFEQGKVVTGKESFEVNGYQVTTSSCTCPYYQTHKEKCKHMVAVELYIAEQKRQKKEDVRNAIHWIANASVETLLKLTPDKQCKAMKLLAQRVLELEEKLLKLQIKELEKLVP